MSTCLRAGHEVTFLQSDANTVFLDRSGPFVLATYNILLQTLGNGGVFKGSERGRDVFSAHFYRNVIVLCVKVLTQQDIIKVFALRDMLREVK